MSRIETIGNATIRFGDCRESMRSMIAEKEKVQMCVTSPPYFGLRSYFPGGVRLKQGLAPDVKDAVLEELATLGIAPTLD